MASVRINKKTRLTLLAGVALLFVIGGREHSRSRTTEVDQARRLAGAMGWHAGQRIAEIGVGNGTMSMFAAQQVGPTGLVYANEIDSARLKEIEKRAAQQGVRNILPIRGRDEAAHLPDACCDAIFMRFVYHHFTSPAKMDASLFRAIRPGGLLAIADSEPTLRNRLVATVRGRTPDGIAAEAVRQQVIAAGFGFERRVESWPGRGYCLLFRKRVYR